MRRVMMLLAVAAFVVAMMLVNVAPAFAAPPPGGGNKPVKGTGNGEFTGGSVPCKQGGNENKCPPRNG